MQQMEKSVVMSACFEFWKFLIQESFTLLIIFREQIAENEIEARNKTSKNKFIFSAELYYVLTIH